MPEIQKTATLTLVVSIDAANIDSTMFAWVDELRDKAIEQGVVISCKLTGIPSELDFA